MMRNILTLLLAILFLTACHNEKNSNSESAQIEPGEKYKPVISGDWKLLFKPDSTIGAYINDHTLYRHESTGKWHFIGITSKVVPANAETEVYFAQGIGDSIIVKGGYTDTIQKLFDSEEKAWAPYAFNYQGKAHIFFGPQKIATSTSNDGMN